MIGAKMAKDFVRQLLDSGLIKFQVLSLPIVNTLNSLSLSTLY